LKVDKQAVQQCSTEKLEACVLNKILFLKLFEEHDLGSNA